MGPAQSAVRRFASAASRHLPSAGDAGSASGRGRRRLHVRLQSSCVNFAPRRTFLALGRATNCRNGSAQSRVRRRGGTVLVLRIHGSATAITAGRTRGSAAGCEFALRHGMASPMPRSLSGMAGGAGSAASGSGSRSSIRIRGRRASTTSSRCPRVATTRQRTSERHIWPATAGAGTRLAGSKWR